MIGKYISDSMGYDVFRKDGFGCFVRSKNVTVANLVQYEHIKAASISLRIH